MCLSDLGQPVRSLLLGVCLGRSRLADAVAEVVLRGKSARRTAREYRVRYGVLRSACRRTRRAMRELGPRRLSSLCGTSPPSAASPRAPSDTG